MSSFWDKIGTLGHSVIVCQGEEIFDQLAMALQAEIRRPPYPTG
jgi:hypothetical protein